MKKLYLIDRADEYSSAYTEPLSMIVCAKNSNDALMITLDDEDDNNLWYGTEHVGVNGIFGYRRNDPFTKRYLEPAFKEVTYLGIAADNIPLNSIVYIRYLD